MKHPFQLLISDKSGNRLFTSNQNTIQVFDISNGHSIGEWKDDIKSQHQANNQIDTRTGKKIRSKQPILNYIRYMILTPDETHLIACTDSDKSILIFDISSDFNCLNLIKRQCLLKRPSSLTSNNSMVLVSDKFGDVYEIPIDSAPPETELENLQPIMGHVSMLLDLELVTKNNKQFLITCDRDEHIRISNYPKSYVIKSYLLQHKKFVSKLYLKDSNYLISGGGDSYLCLWNWYLNKLICKIDVLKYVIDYLQDDYHLPPKRFRNENENELDSNWEISIVQIDCIDDFLIVLVEHTSILLIYKFKNENEIEFYQILKFKDYIINFTTTKKENDLKLFVSLDSEFESLQFVNFQNEKFEIQEENEIGTKIINQISIDVDSKNDFQQLYNISSLRKRKEN